MGSVATGGLGANPVLVNTGTASSCVAWLPVAEPPACETRLRESKVAEQPCVKASKARAEEGGR